MRSFLLVFLVFLGVVSVRGAESSLPISLEDVRCVNKSAKVVHDAIVNYGKYKDLDDQIAFINVGFYRVKSVDMVRSNPRSVSSLLSQADSRNITLQLEAPSPLSRDTDQIVSVEMVPMELDDSSIHPRFNLECRSRWGDAKQFQHFCRLTREIQKLEPHSLTYGLRFFRSDLRVVENSPACDGKTRLEYKLVLQTEPEHVSAIKRSALGEFSFMATLVDVVFREDKFFTDYYRAFYQAWLKSL